MIFVMPSTLAAIISVSLSFPVVPLDICGIKERGVL
jgi:hypothetical protein